MKLKVAVLLVHDTGQEHIDILICTKHVQGAAHREML